MHLLLNRWTGFFLGLLIPFSLAFLAFPFRLNPVLLRMGASPLTLALVGGLLLANVPAFRPTVAVERGIQFVQKNVLRWGIVLYGLRLSFEDLQSIGLRGIVIDAGVVASTFLLGSYIGIKWFKLDPHSAMLNASGSSICGAAAVVATESVLKSDARKASMAVGTVVLFGTLSMLLYPVLYRLMNTGDVAWFAMYTGSTVHEVAQVVAAGDAIGDSGKAIIMKMARVLMLAPFLLLLGWWERRYSKNVEAKRITIPYFAIGFLGLAAVHSLIELPETLHKALLDFDTLLLSAAMAGLGLGSSYRRLKDLGRASLLHGAVLWLWLIVGGFMINAAVNGL